MSKLKSVPRIKHLAALKTAGIYAVFGTIWIIWSDTLVTDIMKVPESIEYGQTIKGLAYVFITASLVYFLVQKYIHEIITAKDIIDSEEIQLSVALNAANMATWEYHPKEKKFIAGLNFLAIHNIDESLFDDSTKTISEKIIDEDRINFEKSFNEFSNAKNVSLEYRIVSPNGKINWIFLTGKVIKKGKSKYIVGVARDITVRKSEIIALKESEDRLSKALEVTNDALWDWNLKQNNIYISPRCYSLLGYSTDEIELNLNNIFSFLHPDDAIKLGEINGSNLIELFSKNYLEFRLRTKSGNYIWIINRLKVIEHDINNNPERVIGTLSDITERKNTEATLIERNEFIETILENIPIGISASNVVDGKISYINNKIIDIYGWSPEKNINELSYSSIFPGANKNENGFDINADKKRFSQWQNLDIVRKDGSVRSVSIKNIPLLNQNTIISAVNDITEEERAREKLLTSEEKFRTVFNEADIPMLIINQYGKILDANKSLQRLLGYSFDEIKNLKSIADIIYSTDFSSIMFWFQKLVSGEIKYSPTLEKLLVTKNGELLWCRYNSSAIRDANDKFVYSISVIENITASKKAEEESRKLLKAVEQSPNSILITDKSGKIEYVNPNYLNETGHLRSQIIGTPLLEVIFPGSPTAFQTEIFNAIKHGLEYSCDYSKLTQNNEMIWELISISPIKDKDGDTTHMLVLIENITNRKEFETQLIKAKDDAEKADKLKLDFLTQMSHEIRTPLNSIVSYLSLIQANVSTSISNDCKSYFEIINTNSSRLIRTIELILNMSEILSGNFKTEIKKINLETEILDELILNLKPAAEKKGLQLVCINEGINPIIDGDLFSIKQTFAHLLENGIKYTDIGGVKVRLYYNETNNTCVDVIDTGIGISNEHLQKIFLPFMQEVMGFSRVYEGNGLGLSLVKKYLDLNNAKISVVSEKGNGTIFTIIFN